MPDLVISDVRIIEWVDKFDAPSNEVFGFEAVRLASDGTVTPANGTTATEANFQGIATIESDRVGKAITVVRDGLLDVGNALADMTIGDPVYLSDTDGTLATTAGTVSTIVGRVVPGHGSLTADRLLRVRKGG
jgi:hypothetical protein